MKKTDIQDGRTVRKVTVKSSAAEGLEKLFIDEPKDIVYAEKASLKALPEMDENVSEPKLAAAIENRIAITEDLVRDTGTVSASQKIEYDKIASYGTQAAFAKTLGKDKIVCLLDATLAEEKEADILLTESAYNSINSEAADKDQEQK